MTPDQPDPLDRVLREALQCPRPGDEPPADWTAQLLLRVPPPLSAAERREQWLWALAPLAGGAVLALWASGQGALGLPDLSWLPPLLGAALLHAVLPRLLPAALPRRLPKD